MCFEEEKVVLNSRAACRLGQLEHAFVRRIGMTKPYGVRRDDSAKLRLSGLISEHDSDWSFLQGVLHLVCLFTLANLTACYAGSHILSSG